MSLVGDLICIFRNQFSSKIFAFLQCLLHWQHLYEREKTTKQITFLWLVLNRLIIFDAIYILNYSTTSNSNQDERSYRIYIVVKAKLIKDLKRKSNFTSGKICRLLIVVYRCWENFQVNRSIKNVKQANTGICMAIVCPGRP